MDSQPAVRIPCDLLKNTWGPFWVEFGCSTSRPSAPPRLLQNWIAKSQSRCSYVHYKARHPMPMQASPSPRLFRAPHRRLSSGRSTRSRRRSPIAKDRTLAVDSECAGLVASELLDDIDILCTAIHGRVGDHVFKTNGDKIIVTRM